MTDKTNNNPKQWIHASQVASLRNKKLKTPPPKKIEEAFINGQKIFNEWLIEKTKRDKNGNN
jgi:hypothetical protein